ncbi:MAG: OmpA family protein, partial [Pseudomonadota bacterium]
VKVTLSDEGVIVDLMEADGAPLFDSGRSVPSDLMRTVVERITPVLKESGRPVKIVGHTDSVPFRNGSQFTNWELSAERANAARRLAVQYGLPYDLISEVVGKADKMPLVADRTAPENRRISIIMQNVAVTTPSLEAR